MIDIGCGFDIVFPDPDGRVWLVKDEKCERSEVDLADYDVSLSILLHVEDPIACKNDQEST